MSSNAPSSKHLKNHPAVKKPQPKAEPKKKTTSKPVERRIFKGDQKIVHDLYRLENENVVNNESPYRNDGEEMLVYKPHSHFYHTYDSSGRALTNSSPTGSHFHAMTITPQPDGLPPIVECGPAVEWKRVQQGRRWVNKLVPYQPSKGLVDDHTHEVRYMGSDDILKRTISGDAAAVHAMEEKKVTPPSGIESV